MDIKELQKDVHNLAKQKGWWSEDGKELELPLNSKRSISLILAKLALIHSEVSEAVECVRDNDIEYREDSELNNKPEGLVAELADVVIRACDLCEALGVDLDSAIIKKHAFNKTRKHRHGGRLA